MQVFESNDAIPAQFLAHAQTFDRGGGETLVWSGHVCPRIWDITIKFLKGGDALVGILSILSLQECGICCHQNEPGKEVKFCQRGGKRIHHLIVELQVAVGCVVWFS